MPGNLLRKAVRNSTASSIGAMAGFAAALLFAGFRIRMLGVERAGYLMLLDGITSMTAAVGGFGLGTAAIRKMAVFEGRRELSGIRATLGVVLFAGIAVGVAVAALATLAFPWIFKWSRMGAAFRADAFGATALAGLSFLARQVYASYETVLPAMQRYDLIALVNSLFSFLTSGLGFLTVLFYPAMTPLALLVFSLSVIRALCSMALVRYLTGMAVLPKLDLAELVSMGAFGGWVYAGSFSSLLTGAADRMALTTLLGSRSLPYYVIGQNVVKRVHALIAGQSDFLFPMLAGAGEHTAAVVKRVQDRLRWFVTFVSAVLYGGLALMAYPLLYKLVGPGFARLALLPFVLACFQGFLWSIDIVPYQVSWAEGRGAPNAVLSLVQGLLVIG
ncbi:MAG: oligosaccharide flippase family protein, partial [Nitrospiraceae bacterium]|nr:oligosaccharide flippase family protein [Nitrospiraceae bacterium]